jgi:hypothetical protein
VGFISWYLIGSQFKRTLAISKLSISSDPHFGQYFLIALAANKLIIHVWFGQIIKIVKGIAFFAGDFTLL